MASKTEDIALRLWKLKASTLDMSKMTFSSFTYNRDSSDEEKPVEKTPFESKTRIKSSSSNTHVSNYEEVEEASSSSKTSDEKKNTDDLKPTQSYIALIATAILKSKDKRLVLSDIYKYILENYSYFQSQDKSWRNSIRHNLSLNECFIKVGRSEHGKGHYWAIHPANFEDFSQGDFRRRRARRRVRRSFLGNHPYTGYPLRPFANTTRTIRTSMDICAKESGEFRRKIHPMFYESEFYNTRNNFWCHSVNYPKMQESKFDNHCPYGNESIKPPTLIKLDSPKCCTSTSFKSSSFSIDSILGKKTSQEHCCTSPKFTSNSNFKN